MAKQKQPAFGLKTYHYWFLFPCSISPNTYSSHVLSPLFFERASCSSGVSRRVIVTNLFFGMACNTQAMYINVLVAIWCTRKKCTLPNSNLLVPKRPISRIQDLPLDQALPDQQIQGMRDFPPAGRAELCDYLFLCHGGSAEGRQYFSLIAHGHSW